MTCIPCADLQRIQVLDKKANDSVNGVSLWQGSTNFFCKDQKVNILGFGDHAVSVTVSLLCCCCNMNVAINSVNKGHGSIQLSSNTTNRVYKVKQLVVWQNGRTLTPGNLAPPLHFTHAYC